MFRSYGTPFLIISHHQRIKIRCYNIYRSYGTFTFDRAIGSVHFVATDFDPLKTKKFIYDLFQKNQLATKIAVITQITSTKSIVPKAYRVFFILTEPK